MSKNIVNIINYSHLNCKNNVGKNAKRSNMFAVQYSLPNAIECIVFDFQSIVDFLQQSESIPV